MTVTFVVSFTNLESAAEFNPPFPVPHPTLVFLLSRLSSTVVAYDVNDEDALLVFKILSSEWYSGDVIQIVVLPNSEKSRSLANLLLDRNELRLTS